MQREMKSKKKIVTEEKSRHFDNYTQFHWFI